MWRITNIYFHPEAARWDLQCTRRRPPHEDEQLYACGSSFVEAISDFETRAKARPYDAAFLRRDPATEKEEAAPHTILRRGLVVEKGETRNYETGDAVFFLVVESDAGGLRHREHVVVPALIYDTAIVAGLNNDMALTYSVGSRSY